MANDTVKVRYIGRHTDGVVLPLPSGESATVAHKAVVEVPSGPFAEGLLAQTSEWAPSGAAAKEVAAGLAEAQAAESAEGEKG